MAAQTGTPREGETETQALFQSFLMIIVSEIGDKTFLIAAILAMRHPRAVVFAGAFGSLVVMSILSAQLGHLLPTLIPRRWTQTLAALLFLVFGFKMLQEAREMKAGNDKIREEMKEAEEEIEGDEAMTGTTANGNAVPLEEMEEGGRSRHTRTRSNSNAKSMSLIEKSRNYCSIMLGPHFTQAFILTFLGEWGDRSQISTIALAAAHVSWAPTLLLGTMFLLGSFLIPECLSCNFGNGRGSRLLHCGRSHRRTLCIHQDFGQTWCVV